MLQVGCGKDEFITKFSTFPFCPTGVLHDGWAAFSRGAAGGDFDVYATNMFLTKGSMKIP